MTAQPALGGRSLRLAEHRYLDDPARPPIHTTRCFNGHESRQSLATAALVQSSDATEVKKIAGREEVEAILGTYQKSWTSSDSPGSQQQLCHKRRQN
jgi:hypothetical protein